MIGPQYQHPPERFRLFQPRFEVPAGTTVYRFRFSDYGCAADDTAAFGETFISVTLDPEGGYPFFTVPESWLERIET